MYFERFTVAEQLAMAADSDLIVAAHGGGEGWMTVMPRNGALVELRFTGNSNCFAPFAKWAKVRGDKLVGVLTFSIARNILLIYASGGWRNSVMNSEHINAYHICLY